MSVARIQPGLERIAALLKGVDFPWPSVHVAGTNGKGSVCHYASSMLVGNGVKVGKFTSPHLVDRWDCISINGKPVGEQEFLKIERHYHRLNARHDIGASPFEILTATAFTVFNEKRVKVGVVEVGMGGKLDSTNILNNQAVSVITKIARDHEGFLGNTLFDIASHKAGILRPGVPYIVNPSNESNVQTVIEDYARELGAGPQLTTNSFELGLNLYKRSRWKRATAHLLPFQLENLKLAVVAVVQMLQTIDRKMKPTELAKLLLSNTSMKNPGRQELVRVTPVFQNAGSRRNQVLVDGAHNPDAAAVLEAVVSETMRYGQTPAKERPVSGWPVTWVLAMTEGKDAQKYLATLLKPGDRVVTTTFGPVAGMPWVKPMDPKELLELARSVEPQITGLHVPLTGALRAICTAKYLSNQSAPWSPIVLTGSLYLVGDLHRELRSRSERTWWTDPDPVIAADRESFMTIQAEERERVGALLNSKKETVVDEPEDPTMDEQRRLQEELDALDREVDAIGIEEQRVAKEHSAVVHRIDDERLLSAAERLEREDHQFLAAHATPEELAAHLTRAEALKESLARAQMKAEIAVKERAKKIEQRRARKEKRELRKGRRLERARLKKEQAEKHRKAVLLSKRPSFKAVNNVSASSAKYQRATPVLPSKRSLKPSHPLRRQNRYKRNRDRFVNMLRNSKVARTREASASRPRQKAASQKAALPVLESKKTSTVSYEDLPIWRPEPLPQAGPVEAGEGRVRIRMHYRSKVRRVGT
ncbi:dihydrofolate synthetase fol3 [Stagonosporopsis vannaccii]|nr:dihydrofolate synthetase fol3 [Stagonosporopsis vannaccii]